MKNEFLDGVIVEKELVAYGSFSRSFDAWVKRMWNSVPITQTQINSFSTSTGETPIVSTPQTITFSTTPSMDYETSANGIITLEDDVTAFTLENVPDGGGGNLIIIQDGIGGFGITSFLHDGLVVLYLGGGTAIAENINSAADGHTILRYDRLGDYIYISFAPFEVAV